MDYNREKDKLNMFKKILLVNAEYPKSRYDFLSLHTGLGYLSESLSGGGIENDIFDPALDGGYENLSKRIQQIKPDLIGYSMMSFSYQHNYDIISKIKNDFPSAVIVAGGPHISTFGEMVLCECRAIDIAVMFEGEQALSDICNEKAKDEIGGIAYRKFDGKIVKTKPRPLTEDLDRILFPRYKRFNISKYPKVIPIVTSRGCPYQCIFCPIGSVMGNRFRARSAANVADEVEFWYHKGFKDFSIADDVFNLIEQRVYQICDEIEKRRLWGLRIRCSNGIRADRVNRQLLLRMKEAGFYCLAFGVESGSNKVLKALNKGETVEQIEKAIKEACNLGYWVELFFLLGSPSETWPDIKESIDLALKYPIYDAKFYNLIPFPNTKLYKWIQDKNYFILHPPGYLNYAMHHVNEPIFATSELTLKERKKAFRYANRIIKKHTKAKSLEFDKWLTKQKLSDYYNITGIRADSIAWLYSKKWIAKLIRFLMR